MTVEGRHETDRLKWLVERHLRETYLQACALIRRGQAAGIIRPGDATLLYHTFIAVAGAAFSLAPEIRLVSRNDQAADPAAIAALIRSLLIIGDDWRPPARRPGRLMPSPARGIWTGARLPPALA